MDTSYQLDEDETLIIEAKFNPVVRHYIFWMVFLAMVCTVIGIPVALIWLCGWGQWYSKIFYEKMWCVLTTKNLKLRNGVIIQVEKTIPLENIQDLTFLEGPLLKAWNLSMIKVETAGSSHQYGSQMRLIGVVGAHEFRSKALFQRSLLKSGFAGNSSAASSVFVEIRDLLKSIDEKLDRKA